MMKKRIVSTLATVAILWGSPAFSGSRGWGHGMGPGNVWPSYGTSKLGLSESQSGKLRNLREDYLEEVTSLRNRMISLRSEMRLLWYADSPDRDKIMAMQKEMSELQRQFDEKSTEYRLECLNVLTPDQKSKLVGYSSGRKHGRRW